MYVCGQCGYSTDDVEYRCPRCNTRLSIGVSGYRMRGAGQSDMAVSHEVDPVTGREIRRFTTSSGVEIGKEDV